MMVSLPREKISTAQPPSASRLQLQLCAQRHGEDGDMDGVVGGVRGESSARVGHPDLSLTKSTGVVLPAEGEDLALQLLKQSSGVTQVSLKAFDFCFVPQQVLLVDTKPPLTK